MSGNLNSEQRFWIRLVFAHPFPYCFWKLHSRWQGSSISISFIMATYGVASSYTLIMDLAKLMGAPLFEPNGWAQSNCFSSQTRLSLSVCAVMINLAELLTLLPPKYQIVVAFFNHSSYRHSTLQTDIFQSQRLVAYRPDQL